MRTLLMEPMISCYASEVLVPFVPTKLCAMLRLASSSFTLLCRYRMSANTTVSVRDVLSLDHVSLTQKLKSEALCANCGAKDENNMCGCVVPMHHCQWHSQSVLSAAAVT